MRAILLSSFGGIDAPGLSDWPDPVPGPGDELVGIRAMALGPWDLNATQGYFAAAGGSTSFPQQQGWDFAGETSSGRRVIGFVAQPWMGVGAFAERIALASALLTDLPESLSWAQGASLPVCSLTAQLLIDGAGVSMGDRVAVTGAAGMVGGFTVELARARGATVIGAGTRHRRNGGPQSRCRSDRQHRRQSRPHAPRVGTRRSGRLFGHSQRGTATLDGIRDGGRLLTTVPGSLPESSRGITAYVVQVQPDPAALATLARGAGLRGKIVLSL